jgi:hypothetical protein
VINPHTADESLRRTPRRDNKDINVCGDDSIPERRLGVARILPPLLLTLLVLLLLIPPPSPPPLPLPLTA